MPVILENPDSVPAPFADRFAHVARIPPGSTPLMLSGQVAVDENGAVIAPGEVKTQTEVIFGLIRDLLAAYGGTLADVAHLRTFMLDLDRLPEYGQGRAAFFPGPLRPASTTVEVSRLFLPGVELEVEVLAAVRPT
jgi:2-iminobutanoate/2-iminopropanoate deaminase